MTTNQALADSRKRQARGSARQAQIVEAALELFAQSGYRGTGLGALADKVGVTTPALLYYFGTKERLLRAVVAYREEQEEKSFGAPRSTLDHLRKVARFITTNPKLTRLFVILGAENLDEGDPLHDFFVRRYDVSRQVTALAMRDEIEQGRALPGIDTEQLSREIVATVMGLEIQWLMDPDAFDLEATIDAYIDGLRARYAPAKPRGRVTRRHP